MITDSSIVIVTDRYFCCPRFRFKLALQQNELMDVFYDDWFNLSDHDGTFGGKADNHLKVRLERARYNRYCPHCV